MDKMISIDEIVGDLPFPTIDFKFHNSGNADSFMYEFHIEVKEVSIDKRPSFNAELSINTEGTKSDSNLNLLYQKISESMVTTGDLIIYITNNGWGEAINCDVSIKDEVFQSLFPGRLLTKKLTLSSGDSSTAFILKASQANKEVLKKIRKVEFPIPDITISYLDDITNTNQSVSVKPETDSLPGNFGGTLYLTQHSFIWVIWDGEFVLPCIMEPSAVYYVKLETNKGMYVKKYKISHRIARGDVERFKIIISAQMSANFKLKFYFVLEDRKTIESELFSVKIWYPRNTKTPYYYQDGEELLEEAKKKKYKDIQEDLFSFFRKLNSDKYKDNPFLELLKQFD